MARRARAGLVAAGAAVTLLALMAIALRIRASGEVGPTLIEIGLAGLGIVALGLWRRPARVLADAVARARAAGPVQWRPITRRQGTALAAIVLLAFGFRLTMVSVYWPTHQIVSGMPLWDAEMARNLLLGRGFTLNWAFVEREDRVIVATGRTVDPQDFYPVDDSKPGSVDTLRLYAHTPGYAIWLALSFALGGSHRFIYSQWMQAGLDASACLLVFGIGRRLWSNRAGAIGALFYALSPGSVYLAIQPVAAATDSFWVLLVGYGIVRMIRDTDRGTSAVKGLLAIVLGALGGTAMNTLAYTLPLAAAGGAALVALVARPAWRVAGYLVLAHLLLVLALVPWGLRNQRVYGHFTETRQSFWQHTWETLGAIPNPWGLVLNTPQGGKDDAFLQWIRENCPLPCLPYEREAFARDYLIENVFTSRHFPMHMARLVAKQFPGVVYVSRLPVDNPYVGSGVAGRAFGAWLTTLNFGVLFLWPAVLLGLVVTTLRKPVAVAAWIGLAPSLFLILFSLALLVEHRKTTQAYGYLAALAGVACAACMHRSPEDS